MIEVQAVDLGAVADNVKVASLVVVHHVAPILWYTGLHVCVCVCVCVCVHSLTLFLFLSLTYTHTLSKHTL